MIRLILTFVMACAVATSAISAELAYRDVSSTPVFDMPPGATAAQSTYQCWLGAPDNSFIQMPLERYGVGWQLPQGSLLSRVGFIYSGWQDTHGPYPYDLELWNVTTCQRVWTKSGLWAPDAFDGPAYCEVELCGEGLVVGGDMALLVHPLMERSGTMWPMLMTEWGAEQGCMSYVDRLDPQIPPPWQQTSCSRSTGMTFMFSLDINDCPVPTTRRSWGGLKTHYR